MLFIVWSWTERKGACLPGTCGILKRATCWKGIKCDRNLPPGEIYGKAGVRVSESDKEKESPPAPDLCQIEEGDLKETDKVRPLVWQPLLGLQGMSYG